MKFIQYVFTPNDEAYEGVRPINIHLLRLLYFLMFIHASVHLNLH